MGLSLLLPNVCIRDAEKQLRQMLNRVNRVKLAKYKLKMEFRRRWLGRSCLVIVPTDDGVDEEMASLVKEK